MKKINFYIVVPIICCLIIGISLIIIQNNKQNSIERQQQIDILQQEKITEQEKKEEVKNQRLLESCEQTAVRDFWEYVELNGEKQNDGSILAEARIWDRADKRKKEALNNCYRKYIK